MHSIFYPELRSAHVASYGPSSRLPIELLSEIFLMCISDIMDNHNTIHIPLLLSHICSRWRSAAISNPKLWSRLYVQLTAPNSDAPNSNSIAANSTTPNSTTSNSTSPPRTHSKSITAPVDASISQTEMVDTWLKRSGACPLKIFVFWEKAPFLNFHPVLERLMDHCERWETMFFYLPLGAFKSFVRVRERLPMLTELSLGTGEEVSTTSAFDAYALDMFGVAPRLRSVESVNFSAMSFELPWMQLEEIPVFAVDIEESLGILCRGKKLTKVSFMFVGGSLTDWNPPVTTTTIQTQTQTQAGQLQHMNPNSPWLPSHFPFILHEHLRHLTIMTPVWNESVNLAALFPRLEIPQLESLTICNVKSEFGSEFVAFLSRVRGLRMLHLRKTGIGDDVLVEGLRHLTALTHLIVISSSCGAHSPVGGGGGGAAGGGGGGGGGQGSMRFEPEATVTRYLFDALTRNIFSEDGIDGMLLPRLERLEISVSCTGETELDTFVDMIQSRMRDEIGGGGIGGGGDGIGSESGNSNGDWNSNGNGNSNGLASLRHVRVRPYVELDEEFLIRLVEVRDAGVEIEVEDV